MDAEQNRGLGPNRPVVVRCSRPVCRPDLHKLGAGTLEHVGDAEAVTDLDQLAARDEHLATLGQRCQRQQDGGRVVVDDERRLGAGQPTEDGGDVILTRASAAGGDVVLQVRVAASDLLDTVQSGIRQRRSPEIGVDDDAGGVQRPPEARRPRTADLVPNPTHQVARVEACADLLSCSREHRPRGLDRERILDGARQLVHRRQVAQLHRATERPPCGARRARLAHSALRSVRPRP
jgi:hypothetical protein